METLKCKNCGNIITQIDEKIGRAHCQKCQANYALSSLTGKEAQAKPVMAGKMKIMAPNNIRIFRRGKSLLIERHPKYLMGIFGLLILVTVIAVYLTPHGSLFLMSEVKQWISGLKQMSPGLKFFYLVIIGVPLYYLIARAINRVTVELCERKLTITHGPLPWFGNMALTTRDFDQLFVKKTTHTYRTGHSRHRGLGGLIGSGHSHTRTVTHWELWGRSKSGDEFAVVKNLQNYEEARFLEQEIEKFFGIKDWFVCGEASASN